MGLNASASVANSIAIGADTVTNPIVATTSMTIANKTTTNLAGTAPIGTVSIGAEGNERTLTNVAAGRISPTSTDAINGSQLNAVIDAINTNSGNSTKILSAEIDRTKKEVNRVGASSAALAGLHPVDYDPNNKFNIAAAGGFYKGENAFAIGTFYRPNDTIMVSAATTIGNNNNMYNIGISYKFGESSKKTTIAQTDLQALYKTIQDLQTRVTQLESDKTKSNQVN